jgi:hypothetical protein
MSILRRLVSWLPLGWVRHIPRGTPPLPYLDRYTLRKQGPSGTNPWRLYLHNFLAPDGEGHHSHPSTWSFSIVLWGSYTEELLEVDYSRGIEMGRLVRTRRVRWFNWIPSTKYHRITELHPGPGARGVWTLFVCSGLSGRGWGFFVAGKGHVDHTAVETTKVTELQPGDPVAIDSEGRAVRARGNVLE